MQHYLNLVEKVIKAKWDEPALTNFHGTTYTYANIACEIKQWHLVFEQLGINQGDKIAISAKNSANWVIAFLATVTYHAVSVPLLADFTPQNVEKLVNHSDSVLLFTDTAHWGGMKGSNIPFLKAVVNVGDFTCLYAAEEKYADTIRGRQSIYNKAFPAGLNQDMVNYSSSDLEELALINYTSGTTGEPKGIMLPSRSISSNIKYALETIPVRDGDNSICMLPLAHMFGLAFEFLYTFIGGSHVYFLSKAPSPSILLAAFAEVKPYILITVPLVLEKIVKGKIVPMLDKPVLKALAHNSLTKPLVYKVIHDKLMKAFGGNIRSIPTGGAALNPAVEAVLHKAKIPYLVGYGMTECAPLIGYENWQDFVVGSSGKAVDRMQVRVDSNDPENEVGELQVKGDNLMLGYYKNEQATKAAFTPDGWFRTGDLGIIDKDGNIFIKGRSKCMILTSNGQNIYPEEIESVINGFASVSESLVLERNKRLVALVSLPQEVKDDSNLKKILDDILTEANALLPSYSKLSKIEVIEGDFVYTPKHSIKRFLYK